MSLPLSFVRPATGTATRLVVLGAAVTFGYLVGIAWNTEASTWAYDGLLKIIADPSMQITSLGMGVGLAFLLGLVHITSICYFPAAIGMMSLVQAARNNREWVKTVAILTLGSVLVVALFGIIVSAPASLVVALVGSRRTMSQVMQLIVVASGVLMIVVAMGELGLIRRLLPSAHFGPTPAHAVADTSAGARHRRAAFMGLWMAASFGILCPKPLYVALLVSVMAAGSMAYGLGLATSVALGSSILLPASRASRFKAWLAARDEAFHLVQGLVLATVGAMTVAFFWLRYTIPPG